MPKKQTKGSLADKLGGAGRKAFDEHKNDETNYGAGGDLPPGIENGIAQLVECKFDQYKSGDLAGEYFFYAAGVVKSPTSQDGLRVEGLRTSIMEPLCDTPRRSRPEVGDHLAWILNEMRKLGVDTTDIDFDDLEEVAEAIKDDAPHFQFRTWIGEATEQFPNPRVNHQWKGACEYEGGDEDDDVVDETGDEESEEEVEEKPAPVKKTAGKTATKSKPAAAKKAVKKAAKAPEPEPEEESEESDLDTLAEAADSGDENAGLRLTEIGEAAGIETETIENADSWAAVAEMIRGAAEEPEAEESEGDDMLALAEAADGGDEEAGEKLTALASEAGLDPDEYETWSDLATALAGGGETTEESEEEHVPEKGEIYYFKPPKARKAVECEVSAVFEGKKTCNLKSLDDGKSFKSIPWDKLQTDVPF